MTKPDPHDWNGDFTAAEERALESSLAATPSERLKWLEEALAFAYRVGALKSREQPPDGVTGGL